jgi:hypothetical protein
MGDHVLVTDRTGQEGVDRLYGIHELRFHNSSEVDHFRSTEYESVLIGYNQTEKGRIELQANGVRYVPSAHFNGLDSVSYAVQGGQAEGQGRFAIAVEPVNDAPTLAVKGHSYNGEFRWRWIHGLRQGTWEAEGSGRIIGRDIEDTNNAPDGEGRLRYRLVREPAWGDVTIEPTGEFKASVNIDADSRPYYSAEEQAYVYPHDFDDVSKSQAKKPRFEVEIFDSEGASSVHTIELRNSAPRGDNGGCFSPVGLDLDGDGLEFSSVDDSEVLVDIDEDGRLERTAWIGADDALLALDRDRDGEVDMLGAHEIAFVDDHPDARTDMEGIELAFDSNGNGLLDPGDARWADFGVWQDANGDGISDPGEFQSLVEAGIVAIGVESDENREFRADGDVLLHGQATYAREDGGRGVAGDLAFRYEEQAREPIEGTPRQNAAADELVAMGAQRLSQSIAALRGAMAEAVEPPMPDMTALGMQAAEHANPLDVDA